MNLITNYFTSKDRQRHKEFLITFYENLDRGQFKIIHTLVQPNPPTFKELFEFCNTKLSGEICVIANSDIIFDGTIKLLETVDLQNVFVALTRDDMLDRATSQDVWAFRAPIKVRDDMNFSLGQPGCDNRIARIMYELGYEVRNPGKQIQLTHMHKNQKRLPKERVAGPYLCLLPNNDITKKSEYILTDTL